MRAALDVPFGLRGSYFPPHRSTADTPLLTTTDRAITTATVSANWLDDPPPSFKIRWFGFLRVPATGGYSFGFESDDGAVLTIDGQVVVNNGGTHGPVLATGTAALTAGPHAVQIDYEQVSGLTGNARLQLLPGQPVFVKADSPHKTMADLVAFLQE